MAQVYLLLGSNLGDRKVYLAQARQEIKRWPKTKVRKVSAVLETKPEVYLKQDSFLNQAVLIETELNPLALLIWAKMTEIKLGRLPRFRYGPREIDIDLVSYSGKKIKTPFLTLPHPRLKKSPSMRACVAALSR